MMPTATRGDTLVLDEPIPEVEAELDAGDHEAHAAFLAAVRTMVHGVSDARADEPNDVDAHAPEDETHVAEEDLSDWLPGLRVADERPGRRRSSSSVPGSRVKRGARRRTTAEESLGEYVARVEAPRLPRRARRSRPRTPPWLRRTAKLAVAAALLGACVALPWAAPGVPAFLGDLVPGGTTTAPVRHDPPVKPSTEAFVGPIGVSQQAGPYDGVRLQAAGPPREVVVERLHVDSEVVPISGQSGMLLPPSDPQVLGWWREGKPAGAEYGSTVVTGHTVHTGGGALDHLDKLVVGDSIRVRTDNGWIRYVVQRSQIYPTAQLAREAENIFRLGGTGRLVLITCDDWNGVSYESNAVVFATPVDDQPSAPAQ